jgi:alkylated DNA repair dioxygenase AlkB
MPTLTKSARSPPHPDLFEDVPALPAGFRYQPDLIGAKDEAQLVAALDPLPFEPFDFHGRLARREVIGFGYRYDYASRTVKAVEPIPAFLLPLREAAAAFARQPSDAFEQILINAYPPGAGIGWHRDKPYFEDVVGVSLLAPCPFRFRRANGAGWDRRSKDIEPRSAYLLSGPSRHLWEHSIPPHAQRRYSITLRTLAV